MPRYYFVIAAGDRQIHSVAADYPADEYARKAAIRTLGGMLAYGPDKLTIGHHLSVTVRTDGNMQVARIEAGQFEAT